MSRRVERTGGLLRAVCYEIRTENLTFMAGSLAYHAFVSLLPLVLLVLTVLSTVGDATLETGLIDLVRQLSTPGVSALLTAELQRASASAGVSVVGGLFLLWGTLRIFRGLDTAFSVLYQSESRNTFSDQLVDGMIVLVASAVALGALVAADAAVARIADGTAGWVVRHALLVVGLTLALVPMYYVFPDQPGMRVVEVLPGAAVTSLGLLGLQSLIGLYLGVAPRRSVIVAVLVFLTVLYLGNLVLLVGAAVNVVTSNRTREVNVRPLVAGRPESTPEAVDRATLLARLQRIEHSLDERGTLAVDDGADGVVIASPDVIEIDAGDGSPFVGNGPVRLECRWFPERE